MKLGETSNTCLLGHWVNNINCFFPGIITEGLANSFIETYIIKFSKDRKTWKIYKDSTSKEKKVHLYLIIILHSVPWNTTLKYMYYWNTLRVTKLKLQKKFCVQVFEASSNGHTMAFNSLFPPINARYLQIWPQRWHGRVSVQVQVLGCPFSVLRPRFNIGGEAPFFNSRLAGLLSFS